MNSLNRKAFGGLLFLFVVMAALLFIPAVTLDYWQAWLFLAVYFSLSLAITLYLMKFDPKLLAPRMSGGLTAEKERRKKTSCGLSRWLSSAWAVLVLVAMMPAQVWRLLDEERFLTRHLPGYVAYQAKVRFRLVPRVW
jgi:hypothetical protein